MDISTDFDWDGAGDLRVGMFDETGKEKETANYVKRKLSNGLPIPVFLKDEDDEDTLTSYHSCHNMQEKGRHHSVFHRRTETLKPLKLKGTNSKDSMMDLMKKYLGCPICNDLCIEATSTNCGHKFCKDCLVKWRKEKPVCPICSTLITSVHRLYSDDQMIESQLENLPRDVRNRYISTQQKRIEALIHESKSRNYLKKIGRKLGDSLTYLRCKNGSGVQERITSKMRQLWQTVSSRMNSVTMGLLLGLPLGAVLMNFKDYAMDIATASDGFIQYVWLAAKNYNGTIPSEWLYPQIGVRDKGTSDYQTLLERIILFPFNLRTPQ